MADIKPSPPGAMLGKERLLPGGRIELPGGTVKMLIVASYGAQEDMVSGLPKWAENDRFDILAKAPENTPVSTLLLVIRTLLAERFHLQFHNEEKVVAGEFVAPAVPLDTARGRRDSARVPRHVNGRSGSAVAWMGADWRHVAGA